MKFFWIVSLVLPGTVLAEGGVSQVRARCEALHDLLFPKNHPYTIESLTAFSKEIAYDKPNYFAYPKGDAENTLTTLWHGPWLVSIPCIPQPSRLTGKSW